ncbi:DUF6123 family protein [Peribacillus butanolivorans]|uniref:DUF6123 family protein n=1 Tax=Peribacillus TaxID=2675229 RepID=UPI001911857C|nr:MULTISPECIES: DUF6123 family protein [unclassified Peribacillus]MBK5442291.1 hypothetical protein [Peribacillus sp. TH24]MBK5462958.1 hypothetical protein [Peribacillus sp. TH27]MBK5483699.1 hypothetical protein [Peribacillus sp. TH16]WMX53890.1 DUF6123 family protein [Peribacillus sp. R9-11]
MDAEVGQSTEEYVSFLEGKGFTFGNDAIGFIYFGKRYTNASDILVNVAIELTLKVQKNFDGSFYISFLENLKQNGIETRSAALSFAKKQGLLK